MKLIHNSLCGFTSRTDSWTANSVVIFKGRFALRKKNQGASQHACSQSWLQCSVCGCTQVPQHWQQSAAEAGCSAYANLFYSEGFTYVVYWTWFVQSPAPQTHFSPSETVLGLFYAVTVLIYFWNAAPRIFEPCNSANGLCWRSTLSNPFWKIKSPKSTLLSWRESWESIEEYSYTPRELMRSWNVPHMFSCYL